MDLNDILRAQGGIGAIAGQLGISEQQAQQGAAALLPSILAGFGKQAGAGDSALGGLGSLIEGLGGGKLGEEVVSAEPTPVNKGNDILGAIFGSKDVSREVAGNASQSTGIDPALLKKMLPVLAMLVAGYLSSQSNRAGGGLGAVLGQVLGGMGGGAGNAGGLGGMLGSILGGRR